MTVIRCDRCGHIYSKGPKCEFQRTMWKKLGFFASITKDNMPAMDLCDDCIMSLSEWLHMPPDDKTEE